MGPFSTVYCTWLVFPQVCHYQLLFCSTPQTPWFLCVGSQSISSESMPPPTATGRIFDSSPLQHLLRQPLPQAGLTVNPQCVYQSCHFTCDPTQTESFQPSSSGGLQSVFTLDMNTAGFSAHLGGTTHPRWVISK